MKKITAVFIIFAFTAGSLFGQDKSMKQFSLRDITLLDGPFKNAMEVNTRVLLQYDVDRLTAPFLKEAGLPVKGRLFPNWAGLDGHIGGHYLSALSITWAATGNTAIKERLDYSGLIAGDDRWAHIASGPVEYSFDAPFILGDKKEIAAMLNKMQPVPEKPMSFTNPSLFTRERDKSLVLEPFYRIHDSRYMVYWLSMPSKEYAAYSKQIQALEKAKVALDRRTIDSVAVGEQQPEKDHMMSISNSGSGIHSGELWRDASNGGFFEYNLLTKGNEKGVSLMLRYWGNENGNRTFNILIDGKILCQERLNGKWGRSEFFNVEYRVPPSMLKGKESVTVRIQSMPDSMAGGVFYIRLLKK